MSRLVIWETGYLGMCVLLGILLMLLYDILRIGRIVVPHHNTVTGVEDFLYWIMVAASAFLMLYKGDDGRIRWYAVAAIASGMIAFHTGISRLAVPFIGKWLRIPVEITGKVLKRFCKTVTIKFKKVKKRWFHGRTEMEKEEEQ